MREKGGFNHREVKETKDDPWAFFDKYVLADKGESIPHPELSSFTHISEESLKRDQELVEKKQARDDLRIRDFGGPDAFMFENFLVSSVIKNNWFGGYGFRTTKYDDWISGADMVVEWPSETGEPVRVAIDVTAAETYPAFQKKSHKLEGPVLVKYFRSKYENPGQETDMRASMPIIVLGADKNIYEEVGKRNQEMTGDHPLRVFFLRQMKSQADMHLNFLTDKVFSAPRARRDNLREFRNKYQELGKDPPLDEVLKIVDGLNDDEKLALFTKKLLPRYIQLIRFRNKVKEELDRSSHIQIDDKFSELFNNSVTDKFIRGE